MVNSASDETGASLRPLLEECGYTDPSRLATNFKLNQISLPLVGFASKPWDFDSACIAVVDSPNADTERAARSCYDLAAPVVWVRHNGSVDWYVQHATRPELYRTRPIHQFPELVRQHKDQLSPSRIYRGKTLAQIDKANLLDFVDSGLMPVRREEAGRVLGDVVEEMTRATLRSFRQRTPSKTLLHEVFTSVFRLLAAKILKDKDVRGFGNIDLADPGIALAAVIKHYDKVGNHPPITRAWIAALKPAASLLGGIGDLAVVSPETLAYVYEHTLVTKALRKKLGIHATPPWLVDYMVWRMLDWIRDVPEEERHVFEPACGHAPFLLSAMRMLRLELQNKPESEIHDYLKDHIHGVEVDDFAREIARLSLTLADIPNPDGWDLHDGDMYASNILKNEAERCRILLCNPPYERFKKADKRRYAQVGYPVRHRKAVELLNRTLPFLPPGALFGVVVPQGVLHNTGAKGIRDLLLRDYEIREICLFADKVFEWADTETAIILGRRRIASSRQNLVTVRRVREDSVASFARTYEADAVQLVAQEKLGLDNDRSLRLPDLSEIWAMLSQRPTIASIADVGQGFSFAKKGLIAKAREFGARKTTDAVPAFLSGVGKLSIWQTPNSLWLSPSRTPVSPWRNGGYTGKPQILVNYSPVMRGPWRMKALLDDKGHAVTNTYTTVRPHPDGPSAKFLWAIINSPFANAYVYCNALKRHIYDSLIASIPLPARWKEIAPSITAAADAYLRVVQEPEEFELRTADDSGAREALLALDAAVMKAYGLPVRMERALLDIFRVPPQKRQERRRKGVGCAFGDYFPAEYKSLLPLHKFISSAYRNSAVDLVADRMRPTEESAVNDDLREASEAFGGG